MNFKTLLLAHVVIAASVSAARADDPLPNSTAAPTVPGGTPAATAPPSKEAALPTSQSGHDEAPPVAAAGAGLPPGGIVSQAGIGGDVAYGRPGVLELGGSGGFSWATDYRNIFLSPSIGWFVANDLELSAIFSVSNIKAGDSSSWLWSTLIEPSYHVPLNRSVFVFGGLGLGASHESGGDTGFALVPRLGMNLMVGRSGILSPALSYQYISNVDDGVLALNIGYTVMW